MLLLGLPGAAFIYQGDEIGLANGPGVQPRVRPCGARSDAAPDAVGRQPDRRLHAPARPGWRRSIPPERNVEAQRDDPGSLLQLYRLLIEARRLLGDGFQLLEGFDGIVAFERPEHVVAINVTAGRQPRARDESARADDAP